MMLALVVAVVGLIVGEELDSHRRTNGDAKPSVEHVVDPPGYAVPHESSRTSHIAIASGLVVGSSWE